MSQVVNAVVDVGEAVAGVAVGVVGVATGNVGLAVAGASLAASGVTNLISNQQAQSQAQAEQNQVSTTNVPTSGQPYTPGPTPTAGGNAPGGAGTQYIPNEQDVINERADAANLSQVSYEQQGLTSIMGLKEQEQRQESAIQASAAARGLKLEGSPLYQLNAQKRAGATAIGSAISEFQASDKAQQMSTLASYNSGLLNMSNQNLSIQTDLSNQWLSSFASSINTASSFLGKFWNPSQSMQGSPYSYSGGYDPGEWG